MSEPNRGRAALLPILQRASRAAAAECAETPTVHAGVASDDWLVMSADTTESGDRGQWMASDVTVDLASNA